MTMLQREWEYTKLQIQLQRFNHVCDILVAIHSFSLLYVGIILHNGYTVVIKIHTVPLLMELMILWWGGTWNWVSQAWEERLRLQRVAWTLIARSCRPRGIGGCRHSLLIGSESVIVSAVSLSSPCGSNPEMPPETLVWRWGAGELGGTTIIH